jgi:uncharacterized membrane protein
MSTYNELAGQRPHRLEALTDGVFSIAMTLLVLELKDPIEEISATETQMLAGLYHLIPKLLIYGMSFMTLGIFWTGHSTQYTFIRRSDRNLNWITLWFLLFVSMVPFSTNILGNHVENKVSIGIYWLNIFALGLFLFLHWRYATRQEHVIEDPETLKRANAAIYGRLYSAQALYALAGLACFINNYLSIGLFIAIQLNYALGLLDIGKVWGKSQTKAS